MIRRLGLAVLLPVKPQAAIVNRRSDQRHSNPTTAQTLQILDAAHPSSRTYLDRWKGLCERSAQFFCSGSPSLSDVRQIEHKQAPYSALNSDACNLERIAWPA